MPGACFADAGPRHSTSELMRGLPWPAAATPLHPNRPRRFESVLTNQAGGVEATSGCCRNSAGESAGIVINNGGCLEGPNALAGYRDYQIPDIAQRPIAFEAGAFPPCPLGRQPVPFPPSPRGLA